MELRLPTSIGTIWTGLIGVTIYVVLLGLDFPPYLSIEIEATLVGVVVALGMGVFDIVVSRPFKAPDAGLNFSNASPVSIRDFVYTFSGFLLTLLGIWAFYLFAPIYRSTWYEPFFQVLVTLWTFIILLAVPYFYVMQKYAQNPEGNIYWQIGRSVFSSMPLDIKELINHCISWGIKVFFLPLMFCGFVQYYAMYKGLHISALSFDAFFQHSYNFLFGIDVLIATIGYVMTFQLLNTQIRYPEINPLGLFVCLICYPPFNELLSHYIGGFSSQWLSWLADWPKFKVFWGVLILLAAFLHVFCDVAFGLRFSNLTHRGIITHSFYRYSKHPCYIAKNIAWWFIFTPFININTVEGFRNCVGLLLFNFIYYLRAHYEEKCLSPDPIYRQYQAYINQYGVIARFKNILWRLGKKCISGYLAILRKLSRKEEF